ncbi:MAG TPA: hypothetical protein VKT20_01160 [Candidatus Dormibacteraeota bacterium]|nr:hypothetical protein [Candidatus Dormibacteraeota bacterium]
MQPGTYRETAACPYCAKPIHRETEVLGPFLRWRVLHDEPHCYEWSSGTVDPDLIIDALAAAPIEASAPPAKAFNPILGWVRVRGTVKVNAMLYDAVLALPERWAEEQLPHSEDLFGMMVNERWLVSNWPLMWFRLDTALGRPLTAERLAEL